MSYPPTFVSIGDAESLREENEQLVELLRGDGVDVMLDVQKDAVHDFISMNAIPLDQARESAIRSACDPPLGSVEQNVHAQVDAIKL